jgi:hypothetical protein
MMFLLDGEKLQMEFLRVRFWDLPMATDSDTRVVLFPVDTNIMITSPNQERLQNSIKQNSF